MLFDLTNRQSQTGCGGFLIIGSHQRKVGALHHFMQTGAGLRPLGKGQNVIDQRRLFGLSVPG